jgi:hypothetical protein
MNRLRLLSLMLALPVASAMGDDLGGSRASIREQNEVAREHDFTFLRTPAQVEEFVKKERLVEVVPNADLLVNKVSFPYTRPVIKTFIERLAAQYRRATGEQLVVTSLTRPTSMQPRNASPLSVHPAGMAVDFRVPATLAERRWLEATLLSLEDKGLLDATRERRPPHYHVAVFPDEYQAYVDRLIPRELEAAAAAAATSMLAFAREAVDRASAAAADAAADGQRVSAIILLGAALTLVVSAALAGVRVRNAG